MTLTMQALFRIRDILVRIRIRILGSVHLIMDPEPDPVLFVNDFQDDANKKLICFQILLLITF
jgi:hypothetical protein